MPWGILEDKHMERVPGTSTVTPGDNNIKEKY